MLKIRQDPFPFEAARDLLGILRAMYAAAKAEGRGARRLEAIQDAALKLVAAIDMANESSPGTMGHGAAWNRAEAAARQAMDLMSGVDSLLPVVEAARKRVVRG